MFSVFRILSVRLHSEPALNIVEGINCAEGSETQIYAVFLNRKPVLSEIEGSTFGNCKS